MKRTPSVAVRGLKEADFLPEAGSGVFPEGCARGLFARDIRLAAVRFGVEPKDLLLVSGLGGKPDVVDAVRSNAARLPGEGAVPFALGARAAAPGLTIAALLPHAAGSGLSRVIEAARKDADMVCLVVNGGCGQRGAVYDPELAALAGSVGTGWIGRLTPGTDGAVDTIFAAFQRKGFAFVDVVGTCGVCPGSSAAEVPEMRGVLIESAAKRGRKAREKKGNPEGDGLWDRFRC